MRFDRLRLLAREISLVFVISICAISSLEVEAEDYSKIPQIAEAKKNNLKQKAKISNKNKNKSKANNKNKGNKNPGKQSQKPKANNKDNKDKEKNNGNDNNAKPFVTPVASSNTENSVSSPYFIPSANQPEIIPVSVPLVPAPALEGSNPSNSDQSTPTPRPADSAPVSEPESMPVTGQAPAYDYSDHRIYDAQYLQDTSEPAVQAMSVSLGANNSSSIPALPVVTSELAGSLTGNLSVTETGAAQYNIPLSVLPGTGGLAPSISLNYDSRSGDGLLGLGWSISGFSSFTRCPSTIHEDGYNRTVNFDEEDKLCLDGQRLRLQSGNYGQAGAHYRTDNESFADIISHGYQVGPQSFVVKLKNSLIYEYGNTADSKTEASDRPIIASWNLNKVTDRNGNYYEVKYSPVNYAGEVLPARINFTGNGSLAPYNSVRFEYVARKVYINGNMIDSESKLLSKVLMYSGETLEREYRLAYTYDQMAYQAHLVSVTECGSDNVCLPATKLTWGEEVPEHKTWDNFHYKIDSQMPLRDPSLYPNAVGDWNGDGKTDLAKFTATGVDFFRATNSGFQYSSTLNDLSFGTAVSNPILIGDWNGDGLTDIGRNTSPNFGFYISNASGQFTFLSEVYNGYQTCSSTNILFTGDWDGDGRTDFGCVNNQSYNNGGLYLYRSTGTGFETYLTGNIGRKVVNSDVTPVFAGDWNGDGKTDLGMVYQSHNRQDGLGIIFYLMLDRNLTTFVDHMITQGHDFKQTKKVFVLPGDFNGDGATDLIRFFPTANRSYSYYLGHMWLGGAMRMPGPLHVIDGPPINTQISSTITGDWNGDGVMDYGLGFSNAFYTFVQRAGVLLWSNAIALHRQSDNTPVVGDWNGDGQAEFGVPMPVGGHFVFSKTNDTNLLKKITNGFGAEKIIEYKSISDPSVYSKDQGSVYPVFDVQGSLRVVASVRSSNGIGGYATAKYFYSGLKAYLDGSGSAGFARVDSHDVETGIITMKYYLQQADLKGSQYKIEKILNNKVIYRKTDTWSTRNFPNKTYLNLIDRSYEETFDLSGTKLDGKTTEWTLDEYANPTTINVTHDSGHIQKTTSTYTNNTYDWFIGQTKETSVLTQAPGKAAVVKTVAFEYQSATGLLFKEIIEPLSPTFRVTKEYYYDRFGNIEQSQIRGTDFEAVVDNSAYDSRGQFKIKSSNSLGHTATSEYDPRHGLPVKVTDLNGLSVSYKYDTFGRLTNAYNPDGTERRQIYSRSSDVNAPAGTAYFIRTDASGMPPVFEYFDLLGRIIRKAVTGFDGRIIFADKVYNEKGLESNVSEPYFAGVAAKWTSTEFDAVGRPVVVTEPGGRVTRSSHTGYTTTITNALGQKTVRTTNALGQVVSVTDNLNSTLRYSYDSQGNLSETIDPKGNKLLIEYDLAGRKTRIQDPDAGTSTFTYNGLGNLKSDRNARGQAAYYYYDRLGRVTQKNSAEGSEYWTYDQSNYGLGKISKIEGTDGFVQVFTYDSLSRLVSSQKTISGKTHTVHSLYDALGRPKTLIYPSGFSVVNTYNANGYLSEVRNGATNQLYWKAVSKNAKEQIESETYGNGLSTTYSYDPNSSLVSRIKTGNVQDLSFTFDGLANLTSRSDLLSNLKEDFGYDALNRLIYSQVVGQSPLSMTYDAVGNIVNKSDVGNYFYGELGAGPHAVTSIKTSGGALSNTYKYDATGNRISANDETITYTSFNLPIKMSNGGLNTTFKYSPDKQRVEQTVSKLSSAMSPGGVTSIFVQQVERKTYVDNIYEEVQAGGVTKQIHFIRGGHGTAAIYTSSSDGSNDTSYLHKDHLGSVQTITNAAGQKTETLSFDAWGNRRSSLDWGTVNNNITSRTDRGFTGHEHLEEFSLIHMNGRLYDPKIGRFLSTDPVVQEPENLQNLNRYTYVLNNPLSFTDPSGFFFKTLKKIIKIAVIAAVAYYTGLGVLGLFGISSYGAVFTAVSFHVGLAASVASGVTVGFATSIVGSVMNGGSLADGFKAGLKAAPVNALRAAAAFQVGSFFDTARNGWGAQQFGEYTESARAVSHGLAGAGMAELTGGEALSGFLSGSVSSFSGSFTKGLSGGSGYAAAALSGGVASALGGGKFAEGAMNGAFVHLYNHMAHKGVTEGVGLTASVPEVVYKLMGQGIDGISSRGVEFGFFYSHPTFKNFQIVGGEFDLGFYYSATAGAEGGFSARRALTLFHVPGNVFDLLKDNQQAGAHFGPIGLELGFDSTPYPEGKTYLTGSAHVTLGVGYSLGATKDSGGFACSLGHGCLVDSK